jgi:hypothetical protein
VWTPRKRRASSLAHGTTLRLCCFVVTNSATLRSTKLCIANSTGPSNRRRVCVGGQQRGPVVPHIDCDHRCRHDGAPLIDINHGSGGASGGPARQGQIHKETRWSLLTPPEMFANCLRSYQSRLLFRFSEALSGEQRDRGPVRGCCAGESKSRNSSRGEGSTL